MTRILGTLADRRVGLVALKAGSPAGESAATGVNGRLVTPSGLGDRPTLGFFSMSRNACLEHLPAFLAIAAARPGGRDRLLAVIVGQADTAAYLVQQGNRWRPSSSSPKTARSSRPSRSPNAPRSCSCAGAWRRRPAINLTSVATHDSALLVNAG